MNGGYWFALLALTALVIILFRRMYREHRQKQLEKFLATRMPAEVGKLEQTTIDQGFEEMKRSKCVIAGLIRNGSKHVPRIRKQIESLGAYFSDYQFLVVENDSKDDTRKQLLEWKSQNPRVVVLGCGIDVPECVLNLPRTTGHDPDYSRIVKMAYLRNLYLDYIRDNELVRSYDYLIVLDLDLTGAHYIDGIADSFGKLAEDSNIDAISANGRIFDSDTLTIQRYYDPFAFRPFGMKLEFDDEDEKSEWDRKTFSFAFEIFDPLIRVTSGFGGLTIYRIPSLLQSNARYHPPSSPDKLGCEHVPFNASLSRVYVNPGMLFIVLENDLL